MRFKAARDREQSASAYFIRTIMKQKIYPVSIVLLDRRRYLFLLVR